MLRSNASKDIDGIFESSKKAKRANMAVRFHPVVSRREMFYVRKL